MYPCVTHVSASDDYILALDFENGETRLLDMKPYLGFGVFHKLQSQEFFNQVRITFDAIAWPSGIDLDPEFIYQNSINKKGMK
jgi:hypothetical protein